MKTKSSLRLKLQDMARVEPLTPSQERFFNSFHRYSVLMLHGVAGTGKSFIAIYKSLETILEMKNDFKKLVVVRSAVSARDIGHLPGDKQEKGEVYESPYKVICSDLFGKPDAYERLKEQHKLEFELSSFLRGLTYDRSIIVVDEIQNMTYQELSTVITRVGEGSKIIFCGDTRQNDLYSKSGLDKFMRIVNNMRSSLHVEFGVEDIVRGDIVKEFIISEMEYENNN